MRKQRAQPAGVRDLVSMGLAWLLGLAALHRCERLPTPAEYALLAAVLAVLATLPWWRQRPRFALAAGAALLAFAQGALRAELRLAADLHPAWEGRDLVLVGRVDSLPIAVTGQGGVPGWRFEFEVESVGPTPQALAPEVPRRLMLLAYELTGRVAAVTAGERWRFTARLKRAHGLANPGGFDAELWLFEQGLRATGVVRAAERLQAAPWWSLDAARQRLRSAIRDHVADPGMAGVLAALSLGDQNAIGHADWALFRDTGVAHLLSVSGLHVTLFAWLAAALAGPLWRRSSRLCLRLPAPTAARWLGVAAALAYALFSGWGVPSQRTVLMLAAVAALRSLNLRWPWPLVLLAAAVVVTAADPWALMQPGFWLSFGAVGLLMAAGGEPAQGWRARLFVALRTQGIATVGLAPLSLICFAQLSVVGLLANLAAIPLISFIVTPLALLGGFWPPLWTLAAVLMQGLMAWLRLLAAWPAAVWWLPAAPLAAQALALLGAALMVMRLPWRLRLAGLAMTLPLLWPAVPRPAAGEFELLAPDVGQGNAVVVRTAGHVLVFDAGPGYSPGADAGERVLLPLLRGLGVRRLDALVLSHRDGDHVGGAASLMRALPVAELRSSLEPAHPLLAGGEAAARCEAGQSWTWDGVRFELLHPTPAHYEAGLKSNDLSCVLRISAASGRRALLAGDLEAGEERALARREADLRADVLLVPHHGSKTSSSDELLAAVRPDLGIVQAGYRSRFGHPAPAVLARYQAAGIAIVSTPACGAWRWHSGEPPQAGLCERAREPRYWRDRRTPPSEPPGPPADEAAPPEPELSF
ncbi:DNA internalization-related competence protein ComEC/Rec2 [Roseateles sp.]|uniref:DNA internalization-related competence protein ComEC/Rec2 n=1 Tax=Roseateles sp. TaxID=1971397 RepID=UPI002DF739E5|nr:DNA internalization-related competence protein ComEC/Rec2 [Roseateles sp.]HEV6968173.1 DNA internalization-related competence protein ComEC/Rec2 [Roseateles sp.]